jgi:hypothetical protein
MRYHQLVERFVNLLDTGSKRKYADQVWSMLQTTYAKMGGYKGAASAEELVTQPGIWKLVRRGDRITALVLYRDQQGRKSVASATDRTPQGLQDLMMIKSEDLRQQRAWGEVSGRMEQIMLDLGGQPLSNKLAATLTQKKIISLNPDGVHYTRLISGEPHEKIIIGFPKIDSDIARELAAVHGVKITAF